MQEGESELGGLKIPHGSTTPPPSTPGSQPDSSDIPKNPPTPPQTSPAPQTPSTSQPSPTPQPQPTTTSQSPIRTINPFLTDTPRQNIPPASSRLNSQAFTTPQPPILSSSPQPTNFQPFPPSSIPSDTGGIPLASAQPRKSHRGPIIAIIIVVLSILACVVAYFLVSTNFNSSSPASQASDVKTAFNLYTNYVLFGEDSSADIAPEAIISASPFFTSLPKDQIPEYVTTAQAKYDIFTTKYFNDKSQYDPSVLQAFFQDFAALNLPTNEELIASYVSGGQFGATQLIDETYNLDGITDEYLNQYVVYSKELAETELRVIISANEAGCMVDGVILEGCYTISEENADKIKSGTIASLDSLSLLSSNAMNVLESIYSELYNTNFYEGTAYE